MPGNIGTLLRAAAIHLSAVALLWVLLSIAGYAIARWCIKREIRWQKVVRWITAAMVLVFCSVLALYLIPERFTSSLTDVLVPNVVCAAALHALLLAVDRYMRHRFSEGIIPTRLVVAIILIYGLIGAASVTLIKLSFVPLIQVVDITIGYLTRIAVLGLLFVEILAGRCKDQKEPSVDQPSPDKLYEEPW